MTRLEGSVTRMGALACAATTENIAGQGQIHVIRIRMGHLEPMTKVFLFGDVRAQISLGRIRHALLLPIVRLHILEIEPRDRDTVRPVADNAFFL